MAVNQDFEDIINASFDNSWQDKTEAVKTEVGERIDSILSAEAKIYELLEDESTIIDDLVELYTIGMARLWIQDFRDPNPFKVIEEVKDNIRDCHNFGSVFRIVSSRPEVREAASKMILEGRMNEIIEGALKIGPTMGIPDYTNLGSQMLLMLRRYSLAQEGIIIL